MFERGDKVVTNDGMTGEVRIVGTDYVGVFWDSGGRGRVPIQELSPLNDSNLYEYGVGEYTEDGHGLLVEWNDGTRATAEEVAAIWATVLPDDSIIVLVRRPVDCMEAV